MNFGYFKSIGDLNMNNKLVAVVAGAGPGLGQHLVNYLEQNGYEAFGINRSVGQTTSRIFRSDLSIAGEAHSAFKKIFCAAGTPKLVIHNTAKLLIAPFEETTPDDFEEVWRTTLLSAVNVAQEVLPVMAQSGGGTFIVSGATASLRGAARFSAFASAKSALRTLTQSLAKEYGPHGIRVAHVVLDGILNTPVSRNLHNLNEDKMMQLDDVAWAYLNLANQPKSAWTFEADLRPMGENF